MKFNCNKKGTTSVFLTLILAAMIMLIGLFIYHASLVAGKNYADAVFDLAGRSVLSEYDIRLLEEYGILAMHADETEVEKKLKFYVNSSFQGNRIKDTVKQKKSIDPLKLKLEAMDVSLSGYSITNVDLFEKQVIDYMKFAFAKNIIAAKHEKKETGSDSDGNAGIKPEIVCRNEQVINSLPSQGYQSSLDIKSFLKSGIPSLQEMKEKGKSRFLVNEYILSEFLNHQSGNSSRETFFQNETEYILSGSMSDSSNYTTVRTYLIIMRTGLNLTHICTDKVKRRELMAVAEAITPGPPAVLTFFGFAAAWAAAEAENDLRLLESGKKVELFKLNANWALDLEGFKDVIVDGKKFNGMVEPKSKSGISYEDYLRILLYLQNREVQLLRCMDLIQLNMKGTYNKDFDINEYYGGFEFEAVVQGRSFSYIQQY